MARPRGSHVRAFRKWLIARNAVLVQPTNEYEVVRWRTKKGVGILYQDGTGEITKAAGPAGEAWEKFLRNDRHYSAAATLHPRERSKIVRAVMDRDGTACFYCNGQLRDDVTVEHLISVSKGGPDSAENAVLAHEACNQGAGSASVFEKLAMRGRMPHRILFFDPAAEELA